MPTVLFFRPNKDLAMQYASRKTKGRIPWNKGLTKEQDKRVLKYAQTLSAHRKGKNNPYYGHGVRPKKQILTALYIDKKYSRQQLADAFNVTKNAVDKWLQLYKITLTVKEQKRRKSQSYSIEERQRMSKLMKKIVAKKRDVYLKNLFKTSKPTSIEVKFLEICRKHNFPFQYVGDGEYWIGRRNPDFINFEHKLIVEVLGEYWHTPKEAEGRKTFFASYGYQTLLIWQSEFKNEGEIIRKVRSWLSGYSIILQTQ